MATPSLVAVSEEKGVSIVEFTNAKILDEANINEIRAAVLALVEPADRPMIAVDFSHVDHMSSSALGMLIDVRKKVLERNGKLRLCNIKPQLFEAFVITKLDKLLKILPTRAEALASFKD